MLFHIFLEIHADGYDDKYRGNADDRAWLDNLTERRSLSLFKSGINGFIFPPTALRRSINGTEFVGEFCSFIVDPI